MVPVPRHRMPALTRPCGRPSLRGVWPFINKVSPLYTRTLIPLTSAILLLWMGCVSTQVHVSGQAPAGVGSDEAIAFVFFREGELVSSSTNEVLSDEDYFFNCTSNALREAYPTTTVISPQEFRRLAFPELAPDPRHKFAASNELDSILQNFPGYREQRERIVQAGIRYVISVNTWTTAEREEHELSRSFRRHYIGIGIIPYVGSTWNRHSQMTAEVLDFKDPYKVGVIQVEASGRPWFAVIMFIPMGVPAFTETRACGDLGEELAKFFAGETTAN